MKNKKFKRMVKSVYTNDGDSMPGDKCKTFGCDGAIEHENDMSDVSCSCHISPPCSKCCNESPLYCPECDWHEDDLTTKKQRKDELARKERSYLYQTVFPKKRTLEDLDDSKIDYIIGTTGYYGMIYEGVFPFGTSRGDILSLFNTCFGYRFDYLDMDKRVFKLVVYTD